MDQIPRYTVSEREFVLMLKCGYSGEVSNCLKIGQTIEYESELDKRILVMKVCEIQYGRFGLPRLFISRLRKMYLKSQH